MLSVTSENFVSEVIQSDIPVLCDFWATWCPPCRAIVPILEDLSKSSNGQYKIVKIDVDACEDLVKKYNVASIPTLLLFKNGKIVETMVGIQNKQALEKMLEK